MHSEPAMFIERDALQVCYVHFQSTIPSRNDETTLNIVFSATYYLGLHNAISPYY